MSGKGLTEEAAQGFRNISERIGEFFHLFDLSFFVSGFVLLGALTFLQIRLDIWITFPFQQWLKVVAVIIAIYVSGLVAFAAGRLINGRFWRRSLLERRLSESIRLHDLESGAIKAYLGDGSRPHLWRLYIRMWAEVAHRQPESIAYRHLTRYWVMAATYDGVGFALLIWAAILFSSQFPFFTLPLSPWLANISSGLFIGASLLAFNRGAAYYEYQIEDVIAELASMKSPLL
jgi:hypothetical protein